MTQDDDDTFLPVAKVRARYGGVSDMWLWRKLHGKDSDFPKPVYMGKRRFWRLGDLRAYERRLAGADSR